MDVRPPTVTGIVDRLEKQKLVARKPDEKDRRVINISLTKKGESVAKKFKDIMTEQFYKAIKHLDKQDQELYYVIIKKMYGAIL